MRARVSTRVDHDGPSPSIGAVSEPEHGALLKRAVNCPGRELRLNGLASVDERLLRFAPEIEPPTGFESRLLARLSQLSQ